MLLFHLDSDITLAEGVSRHLGEPLAPLEVRHFSDGEYKIRPLTDPQGADVYVLHALHGDAVLSPQDKLFHLLMLIGALREHGAARVTAVVPYLAYARKDRLTKPWDPLSLRYVVQLLEAMKTDQLIVLEAHNPDALQNASRCHTRHIAAHTLFEATARRHASEGPLVVASPDVGGVRRVQVWREGLQHSLNATVGFAMVDKRRSAGVVQSERLVAGDVEAATVLLYDDLIASGETMVLAARALKQAGARRVVACAAHGLFVSPADEVLRDACLDEVCVGNSVPSFRIPYDSALRAKLHGVSCAGLLADAIGHSHGTWRP
jgi:ribose-phosphate pyrophosphokinase